MTGSLAHHPFLVLMTVKDQESDCPQHGATLTWPVQGHGASGTQYVLQGLKGFTTQQMVKSKSRSVFTQVIVLLLKV